MTKAVTTPTRKLSPCSKSIERSGVGKLPTKLIVLELSFAQVHNAAGPEVLDEVKDELMKEGWIFP